VYFICFDALLDVAIYQMKHYITTSFDRPIASWP